MSDMYAIKASTLTALGDAVRNTKGVSTFEQHILLSRSGNTTITVSGFRSGANRVVLDNVIIENPKKAALFNVQANSVSGEIYVSDNLKNLTFPLACEINCEKLYISFSGNDATDYIEFDIIIQPLDENGNLYKYTPSEMVDTINGLKIPKIDPIVLTGDCSHALRGVIGTTMLDNFADKISTKDIAYAYYMFSGLSSESIPFDINLKVQSSGISLASMFRDSKNLKHIPNITYTSSTYDSIEYIFYNCQSLEELPYIYNAYPSGTTSLFGGCYCLREIPEDYFDTWNFSRILSYQYAGASDMLSSCYSLRKLPNKLFENFKGMASKSATYLPYRSLLSSCYAIDEVCNLPVYDTVQLTANTFVNAVSSATHLKRFTFEANEDNTPITVNWKAQTLDFSSVVGYAPNTNYFLNYNSGITADKEVKDDATYQALKNDPDWFTCKLEYSRYNHDSAVETINSLPDASAYLASAGGTNTIKFKGASGSLTDGGAINTLTEAEIAVAAAKGWTVSMV